MAKRGRPTTYRKDFHPDDFISESEKGKSLREIAAKWQVNEDTVYEWRKHCEFSEAIKRGRALLEAWYIRIGKRGMLGLPICNETGKVIQYAKVNPTLFIWMTKNICKWSDRTEVADKNASNEPKYDPDEVKKLADWLREVKNEE